MPNKGAQLRPDDLATFFESMTMLLAAGVPANECPGIIAGDMQGSRLADVAARLAYALSGGEIFVLSQAMQQSGAFPGYAVEMIRLGEDSGRLEATAASLGAYYRRQQALNQSIRSAIAGPVLLMVMMGAVLVFLLAFVLPVFENVFLSLGAASAGQLAGAFTAARVAMAVVGALLALVLVVLGMYLAPGGRERLARLAQSLPFTKRIHYALAAGRLTGGLAMLLASGIAVGEAVEKAGALVDNRAIVRCIPDTKQRVDAGEDLGKSLVESGVLDGFEAKILLSASRAGQTEMAMNNLSAIYSEEANNGIDRLLGMVEPALVGILSVAIGVILLSVMLPLAGILTTFG